MGARTPLERPLLLDCTVLMLPLPFEYPPEVFGGIGEALGSIGALSSAAESYGNKVNRRTLSNRLQINSLSSGPRQTPNQLELLLLQQHWSPMQVDSVWQLARTLTAHRFRLPKSPAVRSTSEHRVQFFGGHIHSTYHVCSQRFTLLDKHIHGLVALISYGPAEILKVSYRTKERGEV